MYGLKYSRRAVSVAPDAGRFDAIKRRYADALDSKNTSSISLLPSLFLFLSFSPLTIFDIAIGTRSRANGSVISQWDRSTLQLQQTNIPYVNPVQLPLSRLLIHARHVAGKKAATLRRAASHEIISPRRAPISFSAHSFFSARVSSSLSLPLFLLIPFLLFPLFRARRDAPRRGSGWRTNRSLPSRYSDTENAGPRYQEEGTPGRLSRATAAAAASKLPASGPHYITLLLC